VCKVDDKRVHKGCMALAIGRPSGSETRMMGLLGMVGRLERSGNKLVQGAAFRDQPLPNPIGGRRILTSFLPPTMIRLREQPSSSFTRNTFCANAGIAESSIAR
jgi:hypothetical protein